jgi:hypothetical protein
MPETYKRTKLVALMEKLAVEEGYDNGAIDWLCERIELGFTWDDINKELRPKLNDVYNVDLEYPMNQIWFWVNNKKHPERRKAFKAARARSKKRKVERSDIFAQEAEEILFKDKASTLTGTEAAMIKERSKFLMEKAKRFDPDTYAEPAVEKTNITLNLGELHMQALMAGGGFSSLKVEEVEEIEEVEEAEYELLEGDT